MSDDILVEIEKNFYKHICDRPYPGVDLFTVFIDCRF